MSSGQRDATSKLLWLAQRFSKFLNPNGIQPPSHSQRNDYENTIIMLRRIIRAGRDRDRPNPQRALCGPSNLSIGRGIDYSNDNGFTKRDSETLRDCISCP